MASDTVAADPPGHAARQPQFGRRIGVDCRSFGLGVALAEAGLIAVVGAMAPIVYAALSGIPGDPSDLAVRIALLAAAIYAVAMRSARLYRLPVLLDPALFVRRHAAVCGLVLLALTGVLYGVKQGSFFSRGTFATFAVMFVGGCALGRLAAAQAATALVARRVISGLPVFLIGTPSELQPLDAAYLLTHYGVREVGRQILPEAPVGGLGLLAAPRLARDAGARAFLLCPGVAGAAEMRDIERALSRSPLPARLAPDRAIRAVIDRSSPAEDPSRHLVVLQRAPMGAVEHASKRCADVLLAGAALLTLAPLLVLVGLAIKLDSPGPLLFRQRRSGFDQHQFSIVKFRTMAVELPGELRQACRGDRRVTRVGALLRRSSLDELPQLWNVLRGDMSLVGPRPHAVEHDHHYQALIEDYPLRHHVRPGMTGWAQVNGLRGETSHPAAMARRVDLDLWYIRNWSPLLDLRILARTVFEVMRLDAY